MNSPQRLELLLQKHHSGLLDSQETFELRELLKSDPDALDHYLDLCQLDEQLSTLNEERGLLPVGVDISTAAGGYSIPMAPTLMFLAVALLLCVGIAVRRSRPVQETTLAMNDHRSYVPANAADKIGLPTTGQPTTGQPTTGQPTTTGQQKRKPNPWKVINSTGSMNHPSLTEVSVPQIVSAASRKIQFNRDIRPILSETCFHCHGPDEEGRRADLRLDTIEGAKRDLGGYQAISPSDLQGSEAWTRISSDDPDLMMPPPESHLVLSDEQKTLLKRWIEQGAEYEGHWAFIPPSKPEIPAVNFADTEGESTWVRGAIDSFVAARLAAAKMSPSIEADPRTLIRRLTLDLIGLPPTIEETREFVSEYETGGEKAYQDAVNRLLESPHFGERMAVRWLDQARYADTNGYSIDGGRGHVVVARLGHSGLQRQHALRSVSDGATRGRPVTQRHQCAKDRDRI